MKFLVPNYSCLQNPWLGGLPPPDPRSFCPLSSTEFVEPPPKKNSWVRHWSPVRPILGVWTFLESKLKKESRCTYKRNTGARSRNHCCPGKATNVTYYVSGALVIRRAKRVRSIMFSSVACLALQYFSALTHKRPDLRGKSFFVTQNVFWFSLQLLSETFLILRRTERDLIKNVYWFPCKVPIILVGF